VFGILDGHGGKEVVKYVQKVLPETIKKEYNTDKSIEKSLMRSFSKVDSQLKIFGASDMGCTACIACCSPCPSGIRIQIANIGDCRAIIALKSGKPLRITNDHKASEKSEQERVKKANGVILNNRVNGTLAITRAFGDFDLKKAGVIVEPECFEL
jgi:serine/threonine protein phosphatase PrpC